MERKRSKKVLKRAVIIATAVLGAPAVSALAHGQMIQIDGEQASLQLTPRGRLSAKGHGNLSVAMTDRAGTKMAELCVYIDDTPAIDQVTAFALYLKSGLEAEVISTANLIVATPDGVEHPLLAGRARARLEDVDLRGAVICTPNQIDITNWEQQTRRSREYWDRTGPVWLEALGTFAVGQEWRKL